MKRMMFFALAMTVSALASNSAMATVPDLIPVQGVLSDSAGDPVDGPTDVVFSLYAAEVGGTALWTDTCADLDVVEGFFTVYLGSDTALDFASLLSNPEIWLGVAVESDPEMDRIRLAAVPFAVEAQVCRALGSLTEADINTNFATAAHDHDGVYAPASHSHSWSDITSGMPSGFADGVDDVDDTVSWSEISGIVGTTSTTIAAGNHNHDATYVNEGQANSVTSGMITDGQVMWGSDLGTRVVSAFTSSSFTTTIGGSCTNYSGGFVTITVPSAGTVYVHFDTWLQTLSHVAGTTDYVYIYVGTSATECSISYGYYTIDYVESQLPAGTYNRSVSGVRRFSVSGAGTYTYYLNATSDGGGGTDQFYYDNLQATFIP
jgi:hypothetical protein